MITKGPQRDWQGYRVTGRNYRDHKGIIGGTTMGLKKL